MAYRDDIIALGANHVWPLSQNGNNFVGVDNFTAVGGTFFGASLCEGEFFSYETSTTSDTATVPTLTSVQDETVDYCYAIWFQSDRIQQPPTRIFGDGGQTVNNSFFLGFGNSVVAEADTDPDVSQIGSNISIQPNRAYCLVLVFRDIGGGNSELEFLIDGVSQGTAIVSDVSNVGRGGFRIGGVTDTTSYSIGGSPFQLVSPVVGRYNMAATFVGANVPTVAEIRETIFEKGARPFLTYASTSPANMQLSLDGNANTAYSNNPLDIRVQEPTGGGDFTLTADNITHDPLSSIHVQYMGTGTLTWVNINGSNASIGSTPNGGTIIFNTPVTVSINVQSARDFSNIEGARVYIETAAGGPLPAGTVLYNDLTDVNGNISLPFDFSSNQPIVGRVRKGSASPLFKTSIIGGTINSNGLSQTILMVPDE